jgi:hypothetical protein
MEPICKLVVASKNAKAFIASWMAKAGEGANQPQVRSANRQNRKKAKVETERESIEETRGARCELKEYFFVSSTVQEWVNIALVSSCTNHTTTSTPRKGGMLGRREYRPKI